MRELVGVWSSEASGLHYSSAENETLTLGADGRGWFRFTRPGYEDVTRLAWRPAGPGRVELVYRRRTEMVGYRRRRIGTGRSRIVLAFRIAEEDTPLAGRHLVLRIEPPIMFAREFGLLERPFGFERTR